MGTCNHKMMWFALIAAVLYQVSSSCWETENGRKDKYCRKDSTDTDREVRMLLIGKTGVGKSTTGNTILGFRAFDTKISATSVTSNVQFNETDRFEKRLVVIDTPGLFDTVRSNMEVLKEMTKWYGLASPGLHAIILVVQVGRFTDEEQKTVDFFMKAFGEELKNYLIIVFTHKDQLEDGDMTIDDFVRTLDDKSNLKSLIDETKGRYTAIGYKGQQSEREKEVRHILSMIDKLREVNGGLYYSNNIFKMVEDIMKENERKFPNAARYNSRSRIINQEDGLFENMIYAVGAGIAVGVVAAVSGFGSVITTAASIIGNWIGLF